jgi:C_GCAxxG_C_C family probable redox protein
MDKNQRIEEATIRFKNGYACSQAIFTVYGPLFGLEFDKALKIASGFAGGMRLGETCGAVTGAFMVLGLKYCGESGMTIEGRQPVYQAMLKFTEQFKIKNKTILCRDLIGFDLSNPVEAQKATQQGVYRSICPGLVQEAAEILERILDLKA